MNEFSFLADVYRRNDPDLDLLHLAKTLASTPCSPLYRRHTSPDRELQAFLLSADNAPRCAGISFIGLTAADRTSRRAQIEHATPRKSKAECRADRNSARYHGLWPHPT
jgi:hypothetical protein